MNEDPFYEYSFMNKPPVPIVTATQKPMFPKSLEGPVLTKELIEESFEHARRADAVLTIDLYRKDGRRYRVQPAGKLRRLWNWVRGYRP
jgi:hypothetical protein